MLQRYLPTILVVLALAAWLMAAFSFIQIPFTKVPTDWAMDVIRGEYINDSELDQERGERLDFFDRWIRINQRSSNACLSLLRWTSTIGFGVCGIVFVLLALREKQPNHRPPLTGNARE